ncbi:MAG: hypothetical protein J6Y46_00870 [Prevotella sp.]|nr:hypothetical protein [Prevotella sp.]
MKQYLYILIGMYLLLFASCGPQQEAEELVEQFMKQNMKEELDISGLHFMDIDSTRLVNDSVVISLRQQAKRASRYQGNIKYAPDQPFKQLITIRAKYYIEEKEYSDTYYLDMDLTRIVAFKEN